MAPPFLLFLSPPWIPVWRVPRRTRASGGSGRRTSVAAPRSAAAADRRRRGGGRRPHAVGGRRGGLLPEQRAEREGADWSSVPVVDVRSKVAGSGVASTSGRASTRVHQRGCARDGGGAAVALSGAAGRHGPRRVGAAGRSGGRGGTRRHEAGGEGPAGRR